MATVIIIDKIGTIMATDITIDKMETMVTTEEEGDININCLNFPYFIGHYYINHIFGYLKIFCTF
jgi:hypothetical protein